MRRAIVGLGLALLAACSSSHGDKGPVASDSETHFLTLCDRQCSDGLTCICGACTRSCDEASACGEFGAAASCEAPRAADRFSCGANVPAAVCEAECRADGDCAAVGPSHRCEQSVCRAPPRAAATCAASSPPACPQGQHLRAQTDGDDCTTAICEPDSACSGPVEGTPSCFAASSAFSFVAAHNRCERVAYGGCNPTANNFDTAEACWASCEVDNPFDCLEAWEPLERIDRLVVSGISVPALLDRMEGVHRAAMRFADGSSIPLEMTVSDAIAYSVKSADNTNPGRSSFGIPQPCSGSLQVEAAVEFATADGRFAERWPRLAFEILPDGRARARLSLKRPDAPSNDYENAPIQGSFEPENLEPNTCDLTMGLTLAIGPSTFSGDSGFLIANAACDAVVGTTGVGRGSPPGPHWLAIDEAGNGCENEACCAQLSVEECAMAAQCSLRGGSICE